jgi:hypothetical protein
VTLTSRLSEVYAVPKELREILENCLGEDPSPQVLNTYMPEVRRVCYTLLEGLQSKQPGAPACSRSLSVFSCVP